MIIYLSLAIIAGTALLFGVPVGIWSGLGSASGQSGAFALGVRRMMVAYAIFVVLAGLAVQGYGYLTSPTTYSLPKLSWLAWASFLFIGASAVLWMPFYALAFFVTRSLAG